MKKNLFLLTLLVFNTLAFSQVGIDTSNPQGSFNVDGAKDNPASGTPTAAQQANDFAVTSTGQIGIGTTAPDPSAFLEINTAGTTTKKGFLPPRVALLNPTDGVTITLPAKGLVVYHTGTTLNGEGMYVNIGTAAAPVWALLQMVSNSFGSVTGKFSYAGIPNPSITTTVGNLEFRINEDPGNIYLQMRMTSPPPVTTTYSCNRISWFNGNITSALFTITFTAANYNTWQNYASGQKIGQTTFSFLTYISSIQNPLFYESRLNASYSGPASTQFWSQAVTVY
ncbi:hypothetical protein CLU96_4704 [Chryseobacterium sp. 52]|uniref:hypothetical protein n=1 Tax=Chryseobacterium sp. 52 TaxID=2035213 RepID=UPI000C1A49D9|nr:hypothetical protein [Chryseobacterium sp. 52]PIF47637.1 hypothetical protein CLU96_4704 [Chryseobacterium sp. 52]